MEAKLLKSSSAHFLKKMKSHKPRLQEQVDTTGYFILSVVTVWHMLQHFRVARLFNKVLNMVHVILSSH
jgi:hypothetical protein